MSNSERFIAALAAAHGPVCDDCASAKAQVFPRQQVNQIATRLSASGHIDRAAGVQCCYCGAIKKVSSLSASAGSSVESRNAPSEKDIPARRCRSAFKRLQAANAISSRAWHWEGNVQAVLREHLENNGWTITAMANTGRKESGIDLAATRA